MEHFFKISHLKRLHFLGMHHRLTVKHLVMVEIGLVIQHLPVIIHQIIQYGLQVCSKIMEEN